MNHITGTIKELCEAFIASKILDCMMRGKLLRHHMLSLSIDQGNTQQILAILSIFLRKTSFVKTNCIRNRKSFSKSFLPMNRKRELERKIEIEKNDLVKIMDKNDEANFEEDFVCPVCNRFMNSPLKIYSCSKDHHLFCSDCLEHAKILACLESTCKEDFNLNVPNRRFTAERLIESKKQE